ncbi:DUF6046 domain-containing protein [Chitinophaga nivalis]|uniref:DUF6046 domain-containing protein n=1 Tax=Chitinophaga nivalis TaxID=2991709 RepID=A0ABT3IFD9_9BACT|nr:DUF6046 domain-containing protein [Chitinophaga nivalis]MCW3467640.1 DUF6046 domain-containing protein [Chitinophaga nivalis]MCW3482668.1 DUF6046 domain-containing protein [Chitinophaga nivalis]
MKTTYDIRSLFKASWGYTPPVLDIIKQPEESNNDGPYFDKGAFGKSYFMPVTLIIPASETQPARSISLPNPVIRISSRKTIVETAMVNRTGTIKELINTEDFKISIKGVIINDSNHFPEDEIKQLHALYSVDEAITINSVLTNFFLKSEEQKVVITDINWPEVTGIQNVKPYELNLISDHAFDLNRF